MKNKINNKMKNKTEINNPRLLKKDIEDGIKIRQNTNNIYSIKRSKKEEKVAIRIER